MKESRIDSLAEAYYFQRQTYEDAKKVSDNLEKDMRKAERDLVDAMLDQQMRSFSRNDGTSIFLREHVNVQVIKANAEAIKDWLLSEVGDYADFVEETVSKAAVTEFVKSRLKQGEAPADFPAILNVTTRPVLNVKGWKSLDDGVPF